MDNILGKRDPDGYYVLAFKKDVLNKLNEISGVEVEESADIVIVRTKSRKLAKELLHRFREYFTIP